MKKIILSILLLVIATAAFSQQTNPASVSTQQDYLQKSKHQKKIAWAIMGSGIGLIALGPVINLSGGILNGSNPNKGLWLSYLGGAITLTSIPLLIAASKNKKKAMSISFKNEKSPQIYKSGFVYKPVPSLTFKISL